MIPLMAKAVLSLISASKQNRFEETMHVYSLPVMKPEVDADTCMPLGIFAFTFMQIYKLVDAINLIK